MTRGTIYLITHNGVLESCEFNGDMYPDGHGRLVVELLKRVDNESQFHAMVDYFNRTNHNYQDEPLIYTNLGDKPKLELGKYFSDWIFIKNLSGKTITFIDDDKNERLLIHGQILVSHFGSLPDPEQRKELGLVEARV